MTVFSLLFLMCLHTGSFDGSYSIQCAWNNSGNLYATEALCEAAGKERIGKPVFGDFAEDRRIEDSRCYQQWVNR